MRYLGAIFVFFLCLFTADAQNYIGTDFRFSFLANIDPVFNGLPDFDIPIEAFDNVTVTVEYGTPSDNYYLSQTININSGEVDVVSFNQIFLNQNTTGVIDNRSFHVTSTGDIRVYAFHNRAFFSDATPVLPTNALRSDYMVLTRTDPDFIAPALYSVIATEDNTTINILNTGASVNGPAGTPFSITLDAGQVITVASVDGLTGSTITSDLDKPIAVFAGNRQAKISSNCSADNHLYEQLHPTEYWGTMHAIMPNLNVSNILTTILALEDNTEIYAGCNLIATLNAGETYENPTSFTFIVRSSAPVLIALFTKGYECASTGDPNMRYLQPLKKANFGFRLKTNTGFQQSLPGYPDLYFVNLAMPTDETDQITLNGIPVTGWTPFNTLPEISYATVSVNDISTQTLNAQSTAPFWSEYISLTGADAMTMSMGFTTDMEVPDTDFLTVNLGPDQLICEGDTIILDPELGVNVIWQDGSVQESFLVTEPGTYSVEVDNGCNGAIDEITFTLGEAVDLDLPEIYILCDGSEIEIGVPNDLNVDFEWDNGTQGSEIVVTTGGEYTLTATAQGLCATSATTMVEEKELPELTISGPESLCSGNLDTLLAIGSTGIYEWTDESIGQNLGISEPGTYTVTLTDNFGCAATKTYTIAVAPKPEISIEGDNSICQGQTIWLTAEGDSGDLIWDNGITATDREIDSPGAYSVTLTTDDGCQETDLFTVILLQNPFINVSDVDFCASQNITVSATSPNASLTWPGFSDNAAIDVHTGGVYEVVAENACGTLSRNVVFTEVDCSCVAYVPNAFTPNGDGRNDLFEPILTCEPESYSILIFNRWGQLVFESSDIMKKWNGSMKDNTDFYTSDGVYSYVIKYTNPLLPVKETIMVRGTVILLR